MVDDVKVDKSKGVVDIHDTDLTKLSKSRVKESELLPNTQVFDN